jgi:HEAT repeat protein
MYFAQAVFPDDYLTSSNILLATLVLLVVLVAVSYQVGLLGWLVKVIGNLLRETVRHGFLLWQRLLSWASWPVFAVLVLGLLGFGIAQEPELPAVGILCSLALLFIGITACLAYVYIDMESFEVSRGYKALSNPLQGQELAVNLVRYGPRVGLPLLIAASVAAIGGFALLNQGLYDTAGTGWYELRPDKWTPAAGEAPVYSDFLVYTLLHLLRIVDILNVAENFNLHVSYVHHKRWPASTLLTFFKFFFTMVLLQQLFASFRQGRLLWQTIQDYWSPHPPIREQARVALPRYGPRAVHPLLVSLRGVDFLTPEVRAQIPEIITDIGPATVPLLVKYYLRDPNENVRAVAVTALGRLTALEALPRLVGLSQDASALVRQSLAEAVGAIGSTVPQTSRRRRWFRRRGHSAGPTPGWLGRFTGWLRRERKRSPQELAVATLRALLTDAETQVRTQAAASLGRIGSGAVSATPELIALLSDPDEAVRCQAVETLGQLGAVEEATVNALAALLQDPSAEVQASAAKVLGALKGEAAPAVSSLIPLLHDPDEEVRQTAAEAIGDIGTLPQEAAPELVEGLHSRDDVVRAQTAEALGTIGAAAAATAPSLIQALDDTNDRVRAKAAEALGKMGPAAAAAVPRLIKALHDRDTVVRARAAASLGEMGGQAAAAMPALVESLRHSNPEVRASAAGALGRIGDRARPAAAALAEATRDPEGKVRSQAVLALGEIGGLTETSRQALFNALEDSDPQVRAAAVEALGKRDDLGEAGTHALLRALDDASDEVKVQVTRALPQRAGAAPAVIDGLCRLLQDDSAAVQASAAHALGKLGPAAQAAGPQLMQAVQAAEAPVREQAMRAVVLIQPPEAASTFGVGLKDAQEDIRKLASAGLMQVSAIAPEVVPDLVEALRDSNNQVRSNAAYALSRLEPVPDDAVPLLVECTADPDDGLRVNAVRALKAASAEAVSGVVHRLIDDPNVRVRLVAAGYLLRANPADPRGTAVLTEALSHATSRIRKTAVELVASLGPQGAIFRDVMQRRMKEEEEPEIRDLIGQLVEGLGKGDAPL